MTLFIYYETIFHVMTVYMALEGLDIEFGNMANSLELIFLLYGLRILLALGSADNRLAIGIC